jgi:ubiquitin carboxyl-terminal hydrolase 25
VYIFLTQLGKLAGRFLADISVYNPQAAASYNPFREPPPGYSESDAAEDQGPLPGNCSHNFCIKSEQTCLNIPSTWEDGSEQSNNRGKVSAICQKCNWHLDVKTMWTSDPKRICPTDENPMHFFVISQPPTYEDSGRQIYHFRCELCETVLEISYRRPRIDAAYIDLLTNPVYLQARADEASRKDSGRIGIEPQPGIKVLEALSSYLYDALYGKPKKGIPAHNKRFMTSFGDDCVPLLKWLGFYKKSPDGGEELDGSSWAEHETWMLPVVDPAGDFYQFKSMHSTRIRLDDIVEELWAEMRKMPAGQMAVIRHRPPGLVMAQPSIAKLLGADSYEKATGLVQRGRRVGASDTVSPGQRDDEDDCFEGLGIVRDFAASLVMFSFRKQTTWLPTQAAFFYDCVVAISERRVNEELNIVLATLASEGFVTREEVRGAYRYLGFSTQHASPTEYFASIPDSDILGHFDSRLQSTHKSQESDLRRQLKIIGRSRGSTSIQAVADNGKSNHSLS